MDDHADYATPLTLNTDLPSEIDQARDILLTYIRRHEADGHQGERCDTTRIGIMGFLGHCLGIQIAEFPKMTESIIWNNHECKRDDCHDV